MNNQKTAQEWAERWRRGYEWQADELPRDYPADQADVPIILDRPSITPDRASHRGHDFQLDSD